VPAAMSECVVLLSFFFVPPSRLSPAPAALPSGLLMPPPLPSPVPMPPPLALARDSFSIACRRSRRCPADDEQVPADASHHLQI